MEYLTEESRIGGESGEGMNVKNEVVTFGGHKGVRKRMIHGDRNQLQRSYVGHGH